MKIASEEIRTIVVEAYSSGAVSRKQLAEIFGYHIGSIGRWIRENRKTERLAPLPRGHRVSVFNAEERKQLAEFIENNPDATLDEIRNHFRKPCSLVAIHKIVRKLGYVFKKNSEGKRTKTR
jgi:transposase